MRPPDDAGRELVAAAALGALLDARWHAMDLISRKPREVTVDLLRGLAGEMAFSAIARDQLLGVALVMAADELERSGALEGLAPLALLQRLEPAEAERMTLRRDVFAAAAPIRSAESQDVVAAVERRSGSEDHAPAELARRLRNEAILHEQLWDHPRLAAAARTRLVMLFSVPKLLERAVDLDPKGASTGWAAPPCDTPRGRRRPLVRLRGWGRPAFGLALAAIFAFSFTADA
jgi:hypothetical protein